MKKIIVSIIVISFLISSTPLSIGGVGNVEEQEVTLFDDLEQLLTFEGITAREILESLSFIEESDEIILDSDENLKREISQDLKFVEESYEIMKSGIPAQPTGNGDTEYWAVLIGADCSVLFRNPWPFSFDVQVDQMARLLPVSYHWQEEHIKVLKNEEVNLANIILALLWLDLKDDGNDVTLVYYTAHGGRLKFDLKPKDEDDRRDEFLSTYYTMVNPFSKVTDDLFNYLLNRLDSKVIAVLIDSCLSGGMIDSNHKNKRVMMTSSREDEATYPGFSEAFYFCLQQGDDDNGGMVTANEAYEYANSLIINTNDPNYDGQHPVIYDSYQEDLILTEVEIPPDVPTIYDGVRIVNVGDSVSFSADSTDPDEDQIEYGWDWHAKFPWNQDGHERGEVDTWTGFYDSGNICTKSHTWYEPGIYDTRVKARDIHGAEQLGLFWLIKNNVWSKAISTIVCAEDEIVDQFQTQDDFTQMRLDDDISLAQSFIPSSTTLEKIKLKLHWWVEKETYRFTLSLRNNSGWINNEDLITIEKIINLEKKWEWNVAWIEFELNETLELTQGEPYYMILKLNEQNPRYVYWSGSENDVLPECNAWRGDESWIPLNGDFCFVTYTNESYFEGGESSLMDLTQTTGDPVSQQINSPK